VPAISTLPPESASPLSRKTRFRWQPVAETHAYQLEFYDRWPEATENEAVPLQESRNAGRQPVTLHPAPITGQVVAGDRTSASPSRSLLNHLETNKRYYWRLIAIDAQGHVVAASPPEAILHAP
jgi:hypothetical protein